MIVASVKVEGRWQGVWGIGIDWEKVKDYLKFHLHASCSACVVSAVFV